MESQVESKLRLEASLEGQVASKLRLEASLESQVESKWRLDGVQVAFGEQLEAQLGVQEAPKTLQELPKTLQEALKRLQVGLQRCPREVQEPHDSSPSAIRQQTAPPCKNYGFPKGKLMFLQVRSAPEGLLGEPSGVQVALGSQFGGPSSVQVALGSQFGEPSGVQVALGRRPSGVWRAVGSATWRPRGTQDAPRAGQDAPRDAQETPSWVPETSKRGPRATKQQSKRHSTANNATLQKLWFS